MSSKSIDLLVREYVAAVLAGRDAYRAGDVPAHNRWWRREDRVARLLIDRGQGGRAALEELLAHPVPSVRAGAASYVLRWAANTAVPVLEELLQWAKQDPERGGFTEAFQVLMDTKGLLAQHYGVNVLDVEEHVRGRRGMARTT